MITNVHMLTKNAVKFQIAQDIFSRDNVPLTQLEQEAIEIQSTDVVEVARFAAISAANTFNVPVFKTDVGFYIHALNGFPGPLIKFATQALSAQDWLNLMAKHADQNLTIRESVVLAFPSGESQVFIGETAARFTDHAAGEGVSIDQVVIVGTDSRSIATYTAEESLVRWKRNQTVYSDLVSYLLQFH